MVRRSVFVLALLAVAALTFAAGGTEAKSAGAGPVVYKFWTDSPNLKSDNPLYKIIEDETGVRLEVTGVSEDQYATKLQLAAAANDMPDIMGRIGDSSVLTLGRQGLLLALRDVTKQKAPNMWAGIEKRGLNVAIHSGLFGDGKGEFWQTPRFNQPGLANAAMYRVDWFKETGLALPKVPDDLYRVVKAVKQKHPDSIPLMFRASGSLTMWFSEMFGTGFVPLAEYVNTSAPYKEMLKGLARLYREDLIDKEWPTSTEDRLKQAFNAGKVFAEYGYGIYHVGRLDAFLADRGITNADFTKGLASTAAAREYEKKFLQVLAFFDPISMDAQGRVIPAVISNTRGGFEDSGLSFKAEIKNVDAAMKLVNWIYQPDGHAGYTAQYGKKGTAWTFDSDGFGRPTASFDSKTWVGDLAFMMQPDLTAPLGNPLALTSLQDIQKRNAGKLYSRVRDVYSWKSDKERQRFSDLGAQVTPVVDQWRLKFATGQVDVDAGWNDYLAALKAAGLDEYLKLRSDNILNLPILQPVK